MHIMVLFLLLLALGEIMILREIRRGSASSEERSATERSRDVERERPAEEARRDAEEQRRIREGIAAILRYDGGFRQ